MLLDNGVWKVDVFFTLAIATGLLILGTWIVSRVRFLSKYSIPEAVVGGLLAATLLTTARGVADLKIEFNDVLQRPLNVMFFTTVGLMADVRSIAKGGRMLLLYFISIVGLLVMQNVLGGALAALFGIHPVNGLIAGSITLAGGHGTGAAWGGEFESGAAWGVDKGYKMPGSVALAIACATYGLVAGGLLGGPFARWIMSRHNLSGSGVRAEMSLPSEPRLKPEIPVKVLTETLLLTFVALAVGLLLYGKYGQATKIPPFLWSLGLGAILRNLLSVTRLYAVDDRAAELIGSLSLSLFLSMAIMSLKLWELMALAIPVIVILTVQTVTMLAYTALVTFRMMGKDYDAVLLSTGQIGFGLGSTATAIAGMQSVAVRCGYSPQAFLLVPVMGAFLIDVANMAVIRGFMLLPGFGPR